MELVTTTTTTAIRIADRGIPDLSRLARAVIAEARVLLRRRHDEGASGREIVRAYTGVVDRLIATLFTVASLEYFARYPRIQHRCAIVAQGGYGRRELSPQSDIDLVFLYPWKASPYVETVAEKVLYALWDAGLAVGHALRNPRACQRLAERDVTIRTALLDARLICGDPSVYLEFRTAAKRDLVGKRGAQFIRDKLAEHADRHRRYGDSVYLLQPHLKEGAGGLRDVHTALWVAKVKFKIERLRDLVTLGVITERERAEFDASQDFHWRVRNALHFLTGTHQDQLRFEDQEAVAAQCDDGPPAARSVEGFMRRYYLHATVLNRFSETVVDRCVEQTRGFAVAGAPGRMVREGMHVRGGVLTVGGRHVFRRVPANVIRVFGEAQRHGVGLSSATRKHLREHLQDAGDDLPHDADAIAAFMEILHYPQRVFETLREMHKQGVLIRLFPEFRNLLCLVRRDPVHIYTVDEHSLRGVLELERLRAGVHATSCPLLTQVMREEERVEVLLLAMLFHDIGKGQGQGHSARGAEIVRGIAPRLGLNADDAAQLEFLVRHHLLMSHLAQRRDIHDEGMVLDFSQRVGDVGTLRKLYLLTYADIRAVAPGAWNNWRDMLLGELYVRALHLLERDCSVEEVRGARVARIKTRLGAALGGSTAAADLAYFLSTMPDSYFLSMREESMPQHVALVARLRACDANGDGTVETAVRHFPEWDHSEFTVCLRDRAGVFSTMAGVLAAAGLSVVNARINTSRDGVVLDVFRVAHGERRDAVLSDECWSRVRQNLEGALRGDVDVEALVEAWRRPKFLGTPRRGLPATMTAVTVDNAVSRQHTVLDVYTGDRVGVLFAITRCLFHLGLSIHVATITTMVDQVLDVFYVTDAAGRKIEDSARLAEIRAALEARLAEGVADDAPRGATTS